MLAADLRPLAGDRSRWVRGQWLTEAKGYTDHFPTWRTSKNEMWDIRRRVHTDRLPDRRVVVQFDFRAVPKTVRSPATFWLILEHRGVDVCLKDPGFEVDLVVDADLVALTKAWMGDVRLADAMRSGLVRVEGPRALVRAFPGWLARSGFAEVERPRAGAAR